MVDMETIWGQVDLQNNALLACLKKAVRKLANNSEGEEKVRLLDMGDLSEDGDFGSEENEDAESEGSAASDFDDGDPNDKSDDDVDDDARRIRERMEKVCFCCKWKV
jgi:U3 small nucleolar RNA-associated protein MPP10